MRRGRRAVVGRMLVHVALGIAAITAVAVTPTADAQTASTRARVGVLGIGPNTPSNRAMFLRGLGERGYVEGQRVEIVEQHANDDPTRLADAVRELLRAKPNVLFVRGPAATAAAIQATASVPIVVVDFESDPVAARFVKTLARPGANVTGVFMDLPEMSAKQLQLLREMVPGVTRVALLGDPTWNAGQFRATERAAQTFGIQPTSFEVRAPAELDGALEKAGRIGAGALIIFSSPLVFRNSARLAALTRDRRLPSVSLFAPFAEAGGLFSYGPSLADAFRRCGVYVAKILDGAKPAELPVERPERFELVINLKTAKALALTVPPSMLARAEQLIE